MMENKMMKIGKSGLVGWILPKLKGSALSDNHVNVLVSRSSRSDVARAKIHQHITTDIVVTGKKDVDAHWEKRNIKFEHKTLGSVLVVRKDNLYPI
jgi:predicted XRE-type DNA-binding protein